MNHGSAPAMPASAHPAAHGLSFDSLRLGAVERSLLRIERQRCRNVVRQGCRGEVRWLRVCDLLRLLYGVLWR